MINNKHYTVSFIGKENKVRKFWFTTQESALQAHQELWASNTIDEIDTAFIEYTGNGEVISYNMKHDSH